MEIRKEEMAIAHRVSRKMAYRWAAVEREDLDSHLVLWLCENQRALERWRGEEGGMGKLSVALSREANKYCDKEQTYTNGGVLSYDSQYTTTQIEAALPFLWDFTHAGIQHSVQVHPLNGAVISDVAPLSGHTFDDALAVLADISSGYYSLPKADQEVLALRFRDDQTFRKISKTLNITEEAARKRVDRAVQRLTNKLTRSADINGKYNGQKGNENA